MLVDVLLGSWNLGLDRGVREWFAGEAVRWGPEALGGDAPTDRANLSDKKRRWGLQDVDDEDDKPARKVRATSKAKSSKPAASTAAARC